MSRIAVSIFMILYMILAPYSNEIANASSYKEVLILFNSKIDTSLIEKYNGDVLDQFLFTPALKARIPADAIDFIKNSDNVKAVEEDQQVKVEGQLKGWGIDATKTQRSWSNNVTGKGIKVAVLDSGISPHEDLVIAGGASFLKYTNSYADDFGHGTHIAGIIGAKNNDKGIVGVAPDVQLYSVKVLDQEGAGLVSQLVAGIEWAINNQMDIINLSLGSPYHSLLLEQTLYKANSLGISIVAAAGNSGRTDGSGDTVEFPARYPSVIAVAATDKLNKRAYFSSTGNTVGVAAPGMEITSTYLNNGYATFDGTSMAAGFVTGQMALLKEMYPVLSNQGLRQKLLESTLDLGSSGYDTFFGHGLIQSPISLERIDGKDRFEVAVNVSKKGWGISKTVFISNYLAFADALSAAPLAYKYNSPMLLSNPNQLNSITKQEIARLGAKEAIIVGGKGSITDAVVKELNQMGIVTRRIDGKNRFEVSANIAEELGIQSKVVVTNGLNFPDALAIAPYASKEGIPILLSKPNEIPVEINTIMNKKNITSTLVIGGEGSIGPRVYSKLTNPTRIGGKDRYEVAANIFKTYFSGAKKAYVATGSTFSDALTGSVLISKESTGILLTYKDKVPEATKNIVVNQPFNTLVILGGTGSVQNLLLE